jgi:hypothetical protein
MMGLAYIFPKIPQKSAFFSFSRRYVEDGISTCKCWVFSQHLNNYAGNHLLQHSKKEDIYIYTKTLSRISLIINFTACIWLEFFPRFFFFFFFIQYMHSRLSSFKVASDTYHTGNLKFGSNK